MLLSFDSILLFKSESELSDLSKPDSTKTENENLKFS